MVEQERRTTIIPRGATLYHGTNVVSEFKVPYGPAWFTPNLSVADWYSRWRMEDWEVEAGEARPRVLEFEVIKDIKVLLMEDNDEEAQHWRAIEKGTGHNLDRYEFANEVCELGFDGWSMPYMEDGAEVMVCEPKKHVKLVGVALDTEDE